MKAIKATALVLFTLAVLSACKKEAGVVKSATVKGAITFANAASGSNEAAPYAPVHIAYGTKDATTTYDQTVMTDASGQYHIDGLAKGDYFVTSEYTDETGFTYVTGGVGVTINSKKNDVTVDMTLK